MDTKIYLDTNIILDLFDNERNSSKASTELIDKLFDEGAEFYINSDTLTNMFFILKSILRFFVGNRSLSQAIICIVCMNN